MPRLFCAPLLRNFMMACAALAVVMVPGRSFGNVLEDLTREATQFIVICALNPEHPRCRGRVQREPTRPVNRTPTPEQIAQREQNRAVQGALNSFGFDAGGVDGVLGSRSRRAIAAYQTYMGYTVTGALTFEERRVLLQTAEQLRNGAADEYPAMIDSVGLKGLLRVAVDPDYARQFEDGGSGETSRGARGGEVPPLVPPEADDVARASTRCDAVEAAVLATGAPQGPDTREPAQALGEQFCNARGEALLQGASEAARFQLSEASLDELCRVIHAAFRPRLATVPFGAPAQIAEMARDLSEDAGITDEASATGYGQMCLGHAYRMDDGAMALTAALVLVSYERWPYAEIVGHHLREGIGLPAAPEAATRWLSRAVAALEQGAAPAFTPNRTQRRIDVIRASLVQLER